MGVVLLLWIPIFCTTSSFQNFDKSVRNQPIIIVHGLGGTELEMKLDLNTTDHFYCEKKADWFVAWFRFSYDIIFQQCFFSNFKMQYDPGTNRMTNMPGVSVRPLGEFGNVESIRYIDPYLTQFTSYFDTIITMLEKKMNYRSKVDMFSAAYDFRDIGDIRSMNEYFKKLKSLIESAWKNTRLPAIFVSHSFGGILISHFLSKQSKEWKLKYIDAWYSIGTPFGGTSLAVLSIVSGYHFGIPSFLMNNEDIRRLSQTFITNYYMFPSPNVYPSDQVIIETPTKNYTVNNLKDEVMKEVATNGMRNILSFLKDPFPLQAPDIFSTFVYGTNIDTANKLISKEGLISSTYSLKYSKGDGTVDAISLSACKKWKSQKNKTIEIFEIDKGEHFEMLKDDRLLKHLENFIQLRKSHKRVIKNN